MSPRVLRRQALAKPLWGVRSATPVETCLERGRALLLAVPGPAALSHVSAAQIHGLRLPPELAADQTSHVMVSGNGRVRRKCVVGHRGLDRREVVTVDGLRVVGAADTWADLAGMMSEPSLVAVGDGIAAGDGSLEPLRAVVSARAAWSARHTRALASALALCRLGSRSRMESLARVLFARGGLPEPELNVSVCNERGEWVAEVDFYWRAEGLVAEYQGRDFHTGARRASDEARRRAIEEIPGHRVVFITADCIFVPAKARELLSHLGLCLGVPVDLSRIG